MPNGEQEPKKMSVIAEKDIVKGRYMNATTVSHTKEEFVLEFLFIHPPQGALVARLITNPAHMKRILIAIQNNLKKYEEKFEHIEPSEEKEAGIGFQSKE